MGTDNYYGWLISASTLSAKTLDQTFFYSGGSQARMLFVTASTLFEFADPQLNGGGDFPRRMRAWLLLAIVFRFPSISTFDDSDLVIHNSLALRNNLKIDRV